MVMSLRVFPDVEQGSESWHDLRRGLVTASTVGQLITPSTLKAASNDVSRGLTALLVAERLTGYTDPTWTSDDMMRGHDHEPIARDYYAEHYAPVAEVGFMVLEAYGWTLGYSPDGLVGDDGLVEIKCPRSKTHMRTILANEVPANYTPQLQAGLLVSGRDWIDYVSFCAGMPLFVKRVEPDRAWISAITAAVEVFELNAAEMVARYRTATQGLAPTERILDDLGLVF